MPDQQNGGRWRCRWRWRRTAIVTGTAAICMYFSLIASSRAAKGTTGLRSPASRLGTKTRRGTGGAGARWTAPWQRPSTARPRRLSLESRNIEEDWEWGEKDLNAPVPLDPMVEKSEVTTLSGSKRGVRDGKGTKAFFDNPRALTVSSTGIVYVADTHNDVIRRIMPDGETTTIVGSPRQFPGVHQDGVGSNAKFFWPCGITIDKEENLIVADTYNHVLRKVDTKTLEVTTFAGKPRIYAYADGPRMLARFKYPQDVHCAPDGDIYVMDTRNYFVRKISEDGRVTTVEGMCENVGVDEWMYELFAEGEEEKDEAYLAEDGDGVAVDSLGNIYSVDTINGCIDKIKFDGKIEDGFVHIPDMWERPEMRIEKGKEIDIIGLHKIVIDGNDNAYVADGFNNLIHKVLPNGKVLTFAGDKRGLRGRYKIYLDQTDGPSNTARFSVPSGIAMGPDGSIYVSELGTHAIRKINLA